MKIILIVLSLLYLNGCLPLLVAGTAAGGGVAYMMADLEEIVDTSPDKLKKATEKSFEELGIHLISSAATLIDAKITGRTATDKKVTVIAKERGEKRSFVTIRVGLAGDQSLSRRILDNILDNI